MKKKNYDLWKMAKIIFISSQLVLHHASDILDQRIIERNSFVPSYELGNISEAILEMVELVRLTLKDKRVKILYEKSYD